MIYVNFGLHKNIIKFVEEKEMKYVILTDDEEVLKLAHEKGAEVYDPTSALDVESRKEGLVAETKMERLILKLAIKPKIKGYKYIMYIMKKCQEDANYDDKPITKEIYPEVAKHFKTTPNRVERSIRHALETSQSGRVYAEICGCDGSEKPTNAEFISMLCVYFHK